MASYPKETWCKVIIILKTPWRLHISQAQIPKHCDNGVFCQLPCILHKVWMDLAREKNNVKLKGRV